MTTPEILEHESLVSRMANRYRKIRGTLDMSDLVQSGWIGLVKASRRWSPEKGASFDAYAYFWIRASILMAIEEASTTIRIPKKKRRSVPCPRRRSLDLPGLPDTAEHDDLEAESDREWLRGELDRMDEFQAEVLRRRFGIDRDHAQTLREIGDDLGKSAEWIRKVEAKAIGKIRETVPVPM